MSEEGRRLVKKVLVLSGVVRFLELPTRKEGALDGKEYKTAAPSLLQQGVYTWEKKNG